MINTLEKLIVKMPFLKFAFQRWMIEIVARCLGSVGEIVVQKSRFGIERRIRGFFSAPYFGGTNLKIDRHLQIEGYNALQLGDSVQLYGGSHFIANSSNPITIGSNSHIGRNSVLSGLGGISIGDDCLISSGVLIYSITQNVDQNPTVPIRHNGSLKKQVTIGNDVWVGMGARILPGVTIGDHAIVGAGAVVSKSVEPWQVVVGVPAKPIRDRRGAAARPKAKQHDQRN